MDRNDFPTFRLAMLACLCWSGMAHAHDSGFGHSRRALFVAVGPKELLIEYRLTRDRAEALIEMTRMDSDRDGKISAEEKDRFFNARGNELAANLHLRTSKERVLLTFVGYELRHPLVQVFRFRAETTEPVTLDDQNFLHKPGQVRIHAGTGVDVELAQPVDLTHAEGLRLKISREKRK